MYRPQNRSICASMCRVSTLASNACSDALKHDVGDWVVRVTDCVRKLGVQFDAEMAMQSHVTAVCRSAIFHLRTISRIRRYLTTAVTEQVVHAFITSRLDIGNALLYRLPLKQIQLLQKIQNWAVPLIDGAMRYSHATPLLKKLH